MVPALEDMRGVAAVCGGNKIKVVKVDPIQEVLHPVYEIADRSHISSGGPVESFNSVSWSIDPVSLQPILAAGGIRGVIKIFDARGAIEKGMLYGHGGAIFAIAFSPTHPHIIASASLDHTVRIWDTTFCLQRDQIRPGSASNTLIPDWDNPHGQLVTILAGVGGHHAPVCSVAWHPVHPLLATGGMDNQVKIWYLSKLPGFPTHATLKDSTLVQSLHTSPNLSQAGWQPAPVTHLPIFSSKHIHAHWVEQLFWASPLSPILISKSPIIAKEGAHPLAQYASPQNIEQATEVCIWQASILEDVFLGESDAGIPSDHTEPLEEDADVGGLDFDMLFSFKVRKPMLSAEDASTDWGLGMCLARTNISGNGTIDLTILVGNHPHGLAEIPLSLLEDQKDSSASVVILHPSLSFLLNNNRTVDSDLQILRAIDSTRIIFQNNCLLGFSCLLRVGNNGLVEFWKQQQKHGEGVA